MKHNITVIIKSKTAINLKVHILVLQLKHKSGTDKSAYSKGAFSDRSKLMTMKFLKKTHEKKMDVPTQILIVWRSLSLKQVLNSQ